MPVPSYGAVPLSVTFLGTRLIQLVCMVVILGLTSNFVNSIVTSGAQPPASIVCTLTIASLTMLYTLVSIAFYWSIANIGLYVMAGIDACIMLAWIIISVVVGKPVSYMNCYKTGKGPGGDILSALIAIIQQKGDTVSLADWSGLNKSNCLETKAIWGFGICLAITFATSAILLPTLRYKYAKIGGYAKPAY